MVKNKTAYAEALRKLADVIEDHPDLFGGEWPKVQVHADWTSLGLFPSAVPASEQKEIAKRIRRAFGGEWSKKINGSAFYLKQGGVLGFFDATVFLDRDAVCERKIVGTEVITHGAIEAQPAREEIVDVYEWDCGTLLSDDAAPAESGAA